MTVQRNTPKSAPELAADYVLGLLEGAELAETERLIEEDATLRAEVDALAARMASLDDTAGADRVPDGLWERIETATNERPQLTAASVAPARRRPATTRVPTGPGRTAPRYGGFSAGGKRAAAIAVGMAAAITVGYFSARLTAPVIPPPGISIPGAAPIVVAVLSDENDSPGAIIEAYGDNQVRVIPLTEFAVPEGKVLEVWTLYDADVGPVSLGAFERPREITLTGPDLPVPQPEQLYEITLEDSPGSPAGRPLGPILVKGLAVRPPV